MGWLSVHITKQNNKKTELRFWSGLTHTEVDMSRDMRHEESFVVQLGILDVFVEHKARHKL